MCDVRLVLVFEAVMSMTCLLLADPLKSPSLVKKQQISIQMTVLKLDRDQTYTLPNSSEHFKYYTAEITKIANDDY